MPDAAGVPAVPRRRRFLLLRGRRGVTTAIFAMALTGLLGAIGLGTEAALWYADWVQVQGVADAAAMSGAVSASVAAERTSSSYGPAAAMTYVATQNGDVSGSGGVTVTPHYPPVDGSYSGNSNAAEIVITKTEPLRFASLFMHVGPTISVRAVALYKSISPACLLALGVNNSSGNNGTLSMSGNADLSANGCSVAVNSASGAAVVVSSNAQITAYTVETEGGVSCTENCELHLTKPYSANTVATADPLVAVQSVPLPPSSDFPTSGCSSSTPTGPGCWSGISVSGAGTSLTLPGGTYTLTNGISLGGAGTSISISATGANSTFYISGGITLAGAGNKLNIAPGTYFLNNSSLSVGADTSITCSACVGGAGATFVLLGSSTVNIGANASVNFSAPTSNNYNSGLDGIAIYEPLNDTGTNNVADNGSLTAQGAIYTPGATLNFSGNAGTSSATCNVYVANTISISANGYASDQDCAADGYAWGDSKAVVSLVQ